LMRYAKSDFDIARLPEAKTLKGAKAAKVSLDSWEGLLERAGTGQLRWVPSDFG